MIELGRAAPIAGIIIVALMIAGTISVEMDDAWLWALLSLFAVSLILPRGRRRGGPPPPPSPPPTPEP